MLLILPLGCWGLSNDIGRQAKGFYVRPSAAIERGGGFFIPGLEGPKLRIAASTLLGALLVANHHEPPTLSQSISEALAAVALVGLASPYLVDDAKEPTTEQRSLVLYGDVDADEIRWAVATLAQLTPVVGVALVRTGTLLCLSTDDEARSVETERVIDDSDSIREVLPDAAPRLFALFPSRVTRAVVVPAVHRPGCAWVLATASDRRIDDADIAWCARLLSPPAPLLDFGSSQFGAKFS